jgi:hypothetical protein
MGKLATVWALRQIREQVAEMSEEAKRTAIVAEVALSDDEILGRLFKVATLGKIAEKTYSEIYDTTDTEGRFISEDARLIAARFLRYYSAR